jgi:hypothetical protein
MCVAGGFSHYSGLRRLRRCKDFDGMVLDFALYDRTSSERPWPTYRLPAALIQQAGKHGIEIEFSFYGREHEPDPAPGDAA